MTHDGYTCSGRARQGDRLLDNALVTHDSAAIYDESMTTTEDRRHQTPGQRPRQGSNLRPTA
jgi:hypothetical protein